VKTVKKLKLLRMPSERNCINLSINVYSKEATKCTDETLEIQASLGKIIE
jgi:hypothetical protein